VRHIITYLLLAVTATAAPSVAPNGMIVSNGLAVSGSLTVNGTTIVAAASAALTNGQTGVTLAGTFSGNGAGLTNITGAGGGVQYQDTRGFTNSGGVVLSGPVTLGGANVVTVPYGFAAGYLTTASGVSGANANGRETLASGAYGANANGAGTVASGAYGAWANGYNTVAAGEYSTAAGGNGNEAYGNGSFAAGVNARATNQGSFVWSDHNINTYVVSPMANSFTVRATNGIFSTQDTAAPALVIRGNTHYGDGSGLTNVAADTLGGLPSALYALASSLGNMARYTNFPATATAAGSAGQWAVTNIGSTNWLAVWGANFQGTGTNGWGFMQLQRARP